MKIILLAIMLTAISGCATENNPHTVMDVIDGDTIDLENHERVRLSGINAPETGECYYNEAKDRLSKLVAGKEVYLEADRTDKDKYGRLLRYVHTGNSQVNKLLVEEGYVRVFDKYKEDTKKYDELKTAEDLAKKKKLGVWSCTEPSNGCAYVASKNSKTYHPKDCKWAKRIRPENLVCFKSKEDIPEDLKPSKSCPT